jgi:uracil-DNA glycosylase family 4
LFCVPRDRHAIEHGKLIDEKSWTWDFYLHMVVKSRDGAVSFDEDCTLCPRLAKGLKELRREHRDYHGRPVAPFGAPRAGLLIVGLAPGLHGANRTGRPFTGDYAGILLYRTLHKFGFANRPESVSRDDGLVLRACRITNAVKCWPPANKPLPREIATCNRYLAAELAGQRQGGVVLALGRIAHEAVLRAQGLRLRDYPFIHGAHHRLPAGLHLIDSYHCSRYNTQTRRLTTAMFESALRRAAALLGK